jgi:hypothetical protein
MFVRFLGCSVFLSGCIAVLDLDAERGTGGFGGSSSSETSSNAGPNGSGSSSGAMASNGITSSSAVGTGGAPCADPVAHFSGSQFMVLDNPQHTALDADDRVAIGAWVWPDPIDPGTSGYEGTILSRLSAAEQKGYALMVRQIGPGAALYPEFRYYDGGALVACTGQIALAPGEWTHVAGLFFEGHVDEADAGVWVNGQLACTSGDDKGPKLAKFVAKPVIGAALSQTSGFFRGSLRDVFFQDSGAIPPPAFEGGGCGGGMRFYASLAPFAQQTIQPECSMGGVSVTLGASPNVGADDPQWMCLEGVAAAR